MAAAAITELDLLGKLNSELVSLVDHFAALVKAARPPAEEEMGGVGNVPRDRRPPGEMLDVFVEKLLLSAHTCTHLASSLKRCAMLSDFDALVDGVRGTRNALAPLAHRADLELRETKNGVQALLNELEAHYYSSAHRGQLPPHEPSEAMRELSQLALQAAPSGGPDLAGGP